MYLSVSVYFREKADKKFAKNFIDHGYDTCWRQKSVNVRIPYTPDAVELLKMELSKLDGENVRRITLSLLYPEAPTRVNVDVDTLLKLVWGEKV